MSAAAVTWSRSDSNQEFHAVFDNAPLAAAQCDREGNVVAANAALEQLLGIDLASSGTLRLTTLIESEDPALTERIISELSEGKRQSARFDGRTNSRFSWTGWAPAFIRPEGAVLLVAEERRVSQQRLRQAERLEAVGRLAGGVAHDFNNLLTGILLYCDLLIATMEPGHRASKYADEIRKAGLQASGLVRQLLTISRPATIQPRAISLNEVAGGMRNLLARLIGENIELNFRLAPTLGLVKMDPTQAQQILLNLVLNARDAMPRGGRIDIETQSCTLQVFSNGNIGSTASLSCALLMVEDSGVGMDEYTQSHMFEPFFTTKAANGNGLGLVTVHDIVRSNGGLIHVQSSLNRGTRVSVLLPLIDTVPKKHSASFHPVNNGELLSLDTED